MVVVVLFEVVIATGVVMVETPKETKPICSHYLDFLLCNFSHEQIKWVWRMVHPFLLLFFFFLALSPLLCTPQGVSVCSGGAAEILQGADGVFHSLLHFLSRPLFKWPTDTFMKEMKLSISREFTSAQPHSPQCGEWWCFDRCWSLGRARRSTGSSQLMI